MNADPSSEAALALIQTLGICLSLCLSTWAALQQRRAFQLDSMIRLVEGHRELWLHASERCALARLARPSVQSAVDSVTDEEKLFVTLLVHHLHAVYQASELGLIPLSSGMRLDVGRAFARPVIASVWKSVAPLQRREFREFVDACAREVAARRCDGSSATAGTSEPTDD